MSSAAESRRRRSEEGREESSHDLGQTASQPSRTRRSVVLVPFLGGNLDPYELRKLRVQAQSFRSKDEDGSMRKGKRSRLLSAVVSSRKLESISKENRSLNIIVHTEGEAYYLWSKSFRPSHSNTQRRRVRFHLPFPRRDSDGSLQLEGWKFGGLERERKEIGRGVVPKTKGRALKAVEAGMSSEWEGNEGGRKVGDR